MPTIIAKTERPIGIRQEMQAGSNFGGVAPDDGSPLIPTFADHIFKFAPATTAGLFDLQAAYYAFELHDALDLIGVELQLADQTSWKLERSDADGKLVSVYAGTTEPSFVRGEQDRITLLWGDQLKLTTAAATAIMTATLKFEPHRLGKRI